MLDTGDTVQYGLVSGGSGNCASGGAPDVYTDVAAFSGWIREQISSDDCDTCCGCARLRLAIMSRSVSNFVNGLF